MVGRCAIVDAASVASQARAFVYLCDDHSTIAGREFPDHLELWGNGSTPVVLPRTRLDPAQYADAAMKVTLDREYIGISGPMTDVICRSNPEQIPWEEAKHRGIEFRAAGSHPNWTLEYDEGVALTFLADGIERLEAKPTGIAVNSGRRIVVEAGVASRRLSLVIERSVCSENGNVMTTSVTVTLDGRTFRGCGRALMRGFLHGSAPWIASRTPEQAELRPAPWIRSGLE